MNRSVSILPDIVSAGSLFSGFAAILLVAGDRPITAAWLIVIAAILDALDGKVARLLHREGRFGKEVDSLVDVVSFGVAPATLIYHVVFADYGIMGMLVSFLPLVCGMLRLARYNILASTPGKKSSGFVGIPITASGVLLASFYIYIHTTRDSVADVRVWISLVLAVSALMLSPIPYGRFPVVRVGRGNRGALSLSLMLIATFAVIVNPAKAIFLIMILYLFLGPLAMLQEYFTRSKLRIERDSDDQTDAERRSARRPTRRRKGR